jgi:hypothetical protein
MARELDLNDDDNAVRVRVDADRAVSVDVFRIVGAIQRRNSKSEPTFEEFVAIVRGATGQQCDGLDDVTVWSIGMRVVRHAESLGNG